MSALSEWATQIMTAVSHGHMLALLGLILIAAVMEVGMPIPFVLDSTMLFVALNEGFVSFPILLVVLVLFLGRFLGSSILYWLGRLLGSFFIKWLRKRWTKVADRIENFSKRLNQPQQTGYSGRGFGSRFWARLAATLRIPLIIVIARFTPGLLTVSSIAAGTICESYWIFVLGIGLQSILADGLILTVGYLANQGLKILGVTPSVWQLVIGLAVLVPVGWGIFFMAKRRLQRKPK
jgi:membrane protein DedA with SNARE-associated domain